MSRPKICRNCAHYGASFFGSEYAKCEKTGFYSTIQRKYPSKQCDDSFSGWIEKEPLLTRIKLYFVKEKND